MNNTIKAFIDEITVDGKCQLNDMLTEFYKAAGMHFSFEGISEDEKVNMRKITEEMNMNDSFVNHFLENFTEHITPIGLFEVVKHIDTIANAIDVRIGLEKIFKHPSATEHMKNYVKIWLMQPLQVMEKLQEFLAQMMFDDEQILNVALKDKTLFTKAVKKALIHPEDFNLVSFIVYNENAVPARIHNYTEESLAIDIAGCASTGDIRERIVSIKMNDDKGSDTGLDGLHNATECLLKIHQAYPTMQANMINYSTRSINTSMTGGAKLSAAKVVRLYSGDYSDYDNEPEEPASTPEPPAESSPVRGLITNPEGFNMLSSSARRKVAQHLPATRKQFNQIVVNAINSVHTWMPQLINAKTSNRELNRVIDGLAKSYNSISGQQGMVDWFMHKFAPAVNAYRSRGFPSTGIAVVDNVFGGAPVKNSTRIYGSGMSGGVRTIYVNRDEDTAPHRVFGGGVIGDYFDGVRRAQIKFNTQFDDLYRKLTTAVRNVADKQQFTSEQGIARVVEALMSITIGSKKTVMKISGLRPKEDLNTRYTAMVEHVIKTIDNTKLSGFGEVISILRSIVSALKSVKAEAQQLIKHVSEGTKSSEEIVKYISVTYDDLPSKLTPQELHALVESINALVYANQGHQLTAKIERHREENVRDYLKKVTNRTDSINDYYENWMDRWLKYNRGIDADTRSFIKTHLRSVQAAMVYFNEKVDTKLMQWRQKMAKGANITKKHVDDIERLTMTYMHYRPGEKVLQIFAKLEKLRKSVKTALSIGDIYMVTDVVHKIVMNAGYVEMIQELYKVLEIETGDFDWNLFKINLTKLLVDKLVCVDDQRIIYSLEPTPTNPGELFTQGGEHRGFSTAGLYDFANTVYHKIKDQAGLSDWGYNMLFNLVIAAFTPIGTDKGSIISSALGIPDGISLHGNYTLLTREDLMNLGIGQERFSGENAVIPLPSYTMHNGYGIIDNSAAIFKMLQSIGIKEPANVPALNAALWDTTDMDNFDAEHQAIRIKYAMLDHLIHVLANNKVYGTYNAAKLKSFIDAMFNAFMYTPAGRDGVKNGFVIMKGDTPKIGITWDGYFGSSRETTIITDVFHAMIANVLYVFNRYIALRYTGSDDQLPLPVMSGAMLGGNVEEPGAGEDTEGIKMEAGSAIDVIGVHDLKFDKVIPEAVPFYAIALDIFGTFMTTIHARYNNENRAVEESKQAYGDKAFGMYVTISEFSMLHQLYEILKDYTSIGDVHTGTRKLGTEEYLAPLTEVQIKMIVAELNKVWGLVGGSGRERLMNAIDYVIGEINASILFTSKSRYEQLKRDGHLDIDVSSKVEQQFNGLIDELQEAITANLNVITTMNPDAMREFESFLTMSVEKVAKESNETARLNYVRDIINDGKKNVYKTPFEEYYKFCEFVITPIMIAATSYKRLFDLLNQVNTSVEGGSLEMDLNRFEVAVLKDNADIVFGNERGVRDLIDEGSMVNVVDVCRAAHSHEGLTGKMLGAAATLINSPIVAEYNTILIKQALQRSFVDNKTFVMPELWLPMIPSTYPSEHNFVLKATFHSAEQKGRISSLLQTNIALHELYPNIKSDNVIDFANAMLRDFSADFDHLLHTFMTYPGISDRFLMQLKNVHENATTSLKNLMKEGLWSGGDFLLNVLKDKRLNKMTIAAAPRYPDDLNIQAYTGSVNVPALSMQKTGTVYSDSYNMAGTGQTIHSFSMNSKSNSIITAGNQLCQYGPLDWVIYKLASCNTTGYSLPTMLYELLKSNSLIGKHLVECAVDGSKVMYVPHSSGYVYNIVTQNILTRSSTDRNRQESGELKNMNKTWLANLVSVIPGLISYINALARSTEKGVVDYNGIDIEQLAITLTTILESFYEECVPLMPFIPFMNDYVPGTYYSSIERKLSKYHSIAEIYQAIADPECDLDGLKFEWANRPYYINGLQIPFPEYKNRDKFDGIKKWGGSIFQNSLFSDEFNGTMDILARAVVRSRIIKRNASTALISDNIANGDVNSSVDAIDLCIKTIKKCYEMDPVIIERFINNIIRRLRSTATGMLGGYVSYNIAAGNDDTAVIDANPIVKRVKELLSGIFTINGSVEGKDINNDMSIESDINAAISLLYDNPNIRPFYGFAESNDPGKEAYNSAANLAFLHHQDADVKGALKLAAARGNVIVDASTRGKELLAFSVVNQKPIKRLADATRVSEYKGTIATSAMYANKGANPGLTYGQYRRMLRDSVHDPNAVVDALNDGRALNERAGESATHQALRNIIEGYSNTSRLMIASNALSALGLNVMRAAASESLLPVRDNNNGPMYRTVLYEIFNWLSFNANDRKMVLLTSPAAGATPCITTSPIGNDVGAANGYQHVINADGADQTLEGFTRWDDVGGRGSLSLRLRGMNPYKAPNADPNDGGIFSDANRKRIGQVIRSMIYAINNPNYADLGAVVGSIAKNASVELNTARSAADADAPFAAGTDVTDIFSKNIAHGGDVNKVIKALLNVTTAPNNNPATLNISNDGVAKTIRLIILYSLFTRRPELFVQRFIDDHELPDNNRVVSSSTSIITHFAQMLGFDDIDALYGAENGDARPKFRAVLQLLGTLIEISIRTPTRDNIISFGQILGPKIAGYLATIAPPFTRFDRARSILAFNQQGMDADMRHGNTLINTLTSGRLAVMLFDMFYNGSNAGKIANLTTNAAGANLFNAANATINGSLWSSVLSNARYDDGLADANALNNTRFTMSAAAQQYSIGTDNYNFIPLKKEGNEFKPMVFGELNIFNTKYDAVNLDETAFGYGTASVILNAISNDNNSTHSFAADGGASFTDLLYHNGAADTINVSVVGSQTAAQFTDLLRMLGYLSLVRSPLYSTVINPGAAAHVNLLLKSFAWKQFNNASGFNIDTLATLPLLHNDSGNGNAQIAIFNAHADLACVLAVQSEQMTLTDVLRNDIYAKGLTTSNGRYELSRAMKFVSDRLSSRYIYRCTQNSVRGALGYADLAAEDIGTSNRNENNIRLAQLPIIEPSIRPINKLTETSVKIYQLMPRSIAEYMLWNPGYEYANLAVSVEPAEMVHIPFDNVINTAYSYPINADGFDNTKKGSLIIPNANLLDYSLSAGLLDDTLSLAGQNVNNWYNLFGNDVRGAGARNVAFIAKVYTSNDDNLKPKTDATIGKVNVDYDPTALVGKLTSIIEKWCDGFSERAENIAKTDGWSLNMLGGDIKFASYIDKNKVSAGEPYKIYPSIYPTGDPENPSPGLSFYGKLFKSITRTAESIGSLALAYFNRSLLTFSGVLSNFVYPNAIYGKSIFDRFSNGLSKAISSVSRSVFDHSNKIYSESASVKRRWDFYTLYAENFSITDITGKIITASDRAFYALNQCMFDSAHATRTSGIREFDKMTVANLAANFTHGYGGENATEMVQSKISSEFTAPSICNSFLTILHNLIIGKTNDKNHSETKNELAKMEWFIGTETMGALRSIDVLLTYTSVIASLIKQLSFYDMDDNSERTYIPRDPAEPFMGIEPETDKF